MVQTLLVPFDFSPSSRRAWAHALDLAERTGAHLHLRYVQEIPLGPLVGGDPSPRADEQTLQEEFEARCREELAGRPFVPDDDHLTISAERSGDVAPSLVQFAETEDADLIAMGTLGRRGAKRVFFGSTAEEVLRTAPCPVLTARVEEEENGSVRAPAALERLVVPIDFSEASRAALRYAARLAGVYEAPMTLVHVVELPDLPPAYEVEFADPDVQAAAERAEADLRQWGESIETDDAALSYVVDAGDPASTILRVASEPGDLVVMATEGLSGLKRTMLGSVAEDVLRRAPGPVISGRTFPSE
jgi:nucleotide-binding universal stress UspA family protein